MQGLPCLQQAVLCVASLPWPAVTRHVPALIDRHAWPQVVHRQRRPCRRPLPPQRCALPPSLTSALAGRALAAALAALHRVLVDAAATADLIARAAAAAALAAAAPTSPPSPFATTPALLPSMPPPSLPPSPPPPPPQSPLPLQRQRSRHRTANAFIATRIASFLAAAVAVALFCAWLWCCWSRFPFAGALSCFCMCSFVVCVLFIDCERLHDWSRPPPGMNKLYTPGMNKLYTPQAAQPAMTNVQSDQHGSSHVRTSRLLPLR